MNDAAAAIAMVSEELRGLGYEPAIFDWERGQVVAFQYEFVSGSLAGTSRRVGISFDELGYPEYPPHWIHTSPPAPDGLASGVTQSYIRDEEQWLAMSRPPSDFWDSLLPEQQTMQTYISRHLSRIWSNV